jgi:tRNA A37 methylthiotransferase MiaB
MLEWEPGIDAMIGVFDRDKIVEAVARGRAPPSAKDLRVRRDGPAYWISGNALVAARDRGMKTAGLTVNGKDGTGVGYFEDDSTRLRLTPRHYAYLRISEGCNQAARSAPSHPSAARCAPNPSTASPPRPRELLNDGAFELNLIGQDTTSYGDDIGLGMDAQISRGPPFGGGLPRYCVKDDLKRRGAGEERSPTRLDAPDVRLPLQLHRPIIDAIAELVAKGRMLPYIDMPLQHASDNMLTSMRRQRQRDAPARC